MALLGVFTVAVIGSLTTSEFDRPPELLQRKLSLIVLIVTARGY